MTQPTRDSDAGTTRPTRVFYRVVLTNPPTRQDALSTRQRGHGPRHLDPRSRRLVEGLSVFDSIEAAQAVALGRGGKIGRFIAELTIVEGGPIEFELTSPRTGHYTLWGDPADILATMGRVIPIEELQPPD